MDRTDEAQFADIGRRESFAHTETVHFAVIVPAYRPTESLLEVIAGLAEKSIPVMIVVDDGSGPDYRPLFDRAAEFEKVRVIRHAINLGKGAALKSGINYAMCTFPDLRGVITADADGQHDPDDIERVAQRLAAEPDDVILGVRTFRSGVPLRSMVGNLVTRTVMRALVGQQVSDTQTGLRGIPIALLPRLLRLESNGYDFELDALIAVRQQALRITEVPIRTIYEPGNRSSHFNPLIDSMKIYFVLLRFSWVSMMSAVLDTLVFYLAYRRLGNLAASQALGRVLAVAFNYLMVRRAVFFTKLRHASVLPKYLLLVCLSGTASYAGIQLLNSRFHIQPLPAKLMVETLLFFANFAIQRDFIFGRSADKPRAKRARPAWIGRAIAWIDAIPAWIPRALLALVGVLLLGISVYGFRTERLWLNTGWTDVGLRRFVRYSKIFAVAAGVIVSVAPALFVPIVTILVLAATAVALGPLALLAVALFLISACALGSKLLGQGSDAPDRQLLATLLGIAVYIFLLTFLVRLPVNYPAVYLVLMAIPLLLDWRGAGRRLAAWSRALFARRIRPRRQVAAFALLVFVLGMHWIVLPQPESSADGLAMHLAIPVNISLHHAFTYRPDRIFWSVMPMGADWCYTMVYLLGGEFAARLLDFTMLLLVEALLYTIVRRFVSPSMAFLMLALFASTSMVQLVTGSMFIENFLAALVVGIVAAILHFGETGERRYFYLTAALCGTALATKFGGMAFVGAALPVAAIELRRQWNRLGKWPWLTAAVAILLLLAFAAPTYLISWKLTGDPVFPFMNRTFPSYIVDNQYSFMDTHFSQPLTLREPYDLTFHTSRYYEGRSGSLGFHYLLLVPLGFLALPVVRRRPAWIAAAVALLGMLAILKFLPNARYLYPALPLTLIPLAALFGWLEPGVLRRSLAALAVACVLLNALFITSSNFYHGNFYEQSPLSRRARETYIHKEAPIREIGQYMNRQHPGAKVFMVGGADLAAFNADAYAMGWHQFPMFLRILQTHSALDFYRLLDSLNIHYVTAPKPGFGVRIEPPPLRDFLAHCLTPEYQANQIYLAHIDAGCESAAATRAPIPVEPGLYDDFDPAIVFEGPWVRDMAWPRTLQHTVTYSNVAGSVVRFEFDGGLLSYIYTKAPNRGMADVAIDGVHQAPLDLYSPAPQWQRETIYKLNRGHHSAVIAVLPEKNPKSADRWIDVDGFEVQ